MSAAQGNNNTEVAEAIKNVVIQILINWFCYEPTPAKVIKYNYRNRTVNVVPTVNITDNVGDEIDNSEVQDVPVCFGDSAKITKSLPLKGSTGLLIFTKIGIENWLIAGGIQSEASAARFSRKNCFFVPGLHSFKDVNNIIDNGDDYILNFFGKSEFRVKPSGKANITFNSVELLQQIIELTTKMQEIATNFSQTLDNLANAQYGAVPGPTTCAGDLQATKGTIDNISLQINQIKEQFNKAKF